MNDWFLSWDFNSLKLFLPPSPNDIFPLHRTLMKVDSVSVAHFQCPIFWDIDLISRAFHCSLCRCFYKCTNQDILHVYLSGVDIEHLFARADFDNSPRYRACLPSSVNVCSIPSHFQECLVLLHPCCVCPLGDHVGYVFLVQLNYYHLHLN